MLDILCGIVISVKVAATEVVKSVRLFLIEDRILDINAYDRSVYAKGLANVIIEMISINWMTEL